MKTLIALGVSYWCAGAAFAFGPAGHQMVGAIADARLAGKPAAGKLSTMLGGVTLAQAALLPDKIKDWDDNPPDAADLAKLTSNKKLAKQFLAFWKANPKTLNENSPIPYHRWFHYVDIPVLDDEKYDDGKRGRTSSDIVQMIPFCIRVLQGQESEQNSRKITKPVAVCLLAHYVGDIHQPLHVGAEYFDSTGHPEDPDKHDGAGLGDNGGNNLILVLNESDNNAAAHAGAKLHGFWDNDAVNAAFAEVRRELNPNHVNTVKTSDVIHYFATTEPANWKLPATTQVKDWAKAWANEIMPFARQAHERVEFANIHGTTSAAGSAIEKHMPDGISYRDWAGHVINEEIHKAGWRLAALLEQTL